MPSFGTMEYLAWKRRFVDDAYAVIIANMPPLAEREYDAVFITRGAQNGEGQKRGPA